MNTRISDCITEIPTGAFFVSPLLYGGGLCLHMLSPELVGRDLLYPLLVILPCLLLMSFAGAVIRLFWRPRTLSLVFAVVINCITVAFALWAVWLDMIFPVD
jgi:hypothetical protein